MVDYESIIKNDIIDHITVANKVLNDRDITKLIDKMTDEICLHLGADNKILIFGNGGSAADSQHMAAELMNRFKFDREPLPAIALTTDTSVLTSISNDYSYDEIFEKQISALGDEDDIAIAITTGLPEGKHSRNIILGLLEAISKKMLTILICSEKTFDTDDKETLMFLNSLDYVVVVPSKDTARIQEMQLMIEHIICELIEDKIYDKDKKKTHS